MFQDWQTHKPETIRCELLWEYDLSSLGWDWHRMKNVVVRRVFEQGLESDYYAMFQLYGGFEGVREIVKNMPYLEPREIAFACVLLKLKREELYCLKRKLLREKLFNS